MDEGHSCWTKAWLCFLYGMTEWIPVSPWAGRERFRESAPHGGARPFTGRNKIARSLQLKRGGICRRFRTHVQHRLWDRFAHSASACWWPSGCPRCFLPPPPEEWGASAESPLQAREPAALTLRPHRSRLPTSRLESVESSHLPNLRSRPVRRRVPFRRPAYPPHRGPASYRRHATRTAPQTGTSNSGQRANRVLPAYGMATPVGPDRFRSAESARAIRPGISHCGMKSAVSNQPL